MMPNFKNLPPPPSKLITTITCDGCGAIHNEYTCPYCGRLHNFRYQFYKDWNVCVKVPRPIIRGPKLPVSI